ncbi:MAG: hypothetical protein EAX90_14220 [Candidatus Heimdallarchaeota archaeon]|nr:hypothetical protein [Candidatus Heimdallarchaeota archaeon]
MKELMKLHILFIVIIVTGFCVNPNLNVRAGTTYLFQETVNLSAGDMVYWSADLVTSRTYDFSWSSEEYADLICFDSFNFDRYEAYFNGGPETSIVYISDFSAIYSKSLTKSSFNILTNKTLYFAVENADFWENGAPEVPVTQINISLSYSWSDPITTSDTTTNEFGLNGLFSILIVITFAVIRKKKKILN